ncbi:LuxR C-terminal-related transcriptional regulator [Antrihabitans cavernicola]|uniref:HTH luxR-type domain-containing protein n=1 Tax=Antrihabitans cavernicola TaxID=2495913 RepID=A0A5A7S661_9NOCA|nr:LuxR family transcriptional regulator [Spelaeibacter cavernicola]KAA0018910.1 hypothetical protein FOY51_22990 [Spelaeibacter cavernicola]
MRGAWPLTGRIEEMRLVDRVLTAPDEGGGLVIVGQPGVGKSRLAREALAAAASRGSSTAWAVATASARTVPLGALASWTGSESTDPLKLVSSVIDTLSDNNARSNIVVGVDDVHLLDDLSAFVLHQLVLRRVAKVVVTIRLGEQAPDAVTALWKDRHLDRLELQPLSEEQCRSLMGSVLGGPVDPESARRIWTLTRGNVLYLRNVVDQEVSDGRLKKRNGLWRWGGRPVVSPSLIDLIEARIGSLPPDVGDVVDALAVAEPLELTLLERIANPAAIEEADTRGLIVIDRADAVPQARVAHPLYGEVRRARAASSRLRRLRGEISTALGVRESKPGLVRRATLAMDSNLPPNATLYTDAAGAAMSLLDLGLAERLAHAAVRAGGGTSAQIVRAHALTMLSDGLQAEAALAEIPLDRLDDSQRARVLLLRAGNLMWDLADPRRVDDLLASEEVTSDATLTESVVAFRTICLAVTGDPRQALQLWGNRDASSLPTFPAMLAVWGQVIALGDVGRSNDIGPIIAFGFELAAQSPEASGHTFQLSDSQVRALLLAGRIADADAVATRMFRFAADLPGFPHVVGSALMGTAALAAGRLAVARALLDEAVQGFASIDDTTGVGYHYLILLTQAIAMTGDHDAAAGTLEAARLQRHTAFALDEPNHILADAWVSAARGLSSEAIVIARRAAQTACVNGQFAWEVLCLQSATQFGDRTKAERLAELRAQVDGPRVRAAANFASAMATNDAAAMLAASGQFEEIGDRIAAMDAAARAAIAYRHNDMRGSAVTCASRAQRLAQECGGARTPALSECAQPLPLTTREREIAMLVGAGLSNREIANRLSVSVRTIEGHLYRAGLKTGARNRDELGASVIGS